MRHALLIFCAVIVCAICLSSCAERGLYQPQQGSFAPAVLVDGSVAKEKEEPLTDEMIAKSLDYTYSFKKIRKVAFLPIGDYGADLIGFQDDLIKDAEAAVPGLVVRKIPAILLGYSPSLDALRRLSVRMQVDTLVIFKVYTNNRYKPNIFSKDRYRTALSIDYYVLDVRSGLIPHADTVDRVQEYAVGTIDAEKMEEMRRQDLYQAIRAMIDQLAARIAADK